MNETPATKVLPQRRWFQIRLRTLLVLVTLFSLLLGWISWEQERRRQEQTTVAWVIEMGGRKDFRYLVGVGWWKRNWVLTTDKFFGELLREIWFNETNVTDLSPLAGLKNLEVLGLDKTKVSDLSLVAGIENIKFLSLNQTQVSDLSPLAGLSNLEWLYLGETEVSDLSPLAGLKNLEEIWLNDTQVSDLSLLAGLENLRRLSIEGTNVTEEQIEQLQLALPNCKISR